MEVCLVDDMLCTYMWSTVYKYIVDDMLWISSIYTVGNDREYILWMIAILGVVSAYTVGNIVAHST